MLFHRNFNEVSFYENTFLHFSLCRFHSRNHQKREKVDIGSEKITMLSVSVLLLLYLLKIELKYCLNFFLVNGSWPRLLYKNFIVGQQDFGPTFHIQFPYSLLCTRESKYNSILRESFHWIYFFELRWEKIKRNYILIHRDFI